MRHLRILCHPVQAAGALALALALLVLPACGDLATDPADIVRVGGEVDRVPASNAVPSSPDDAVLLTVCGRAINRSDVDRALEDAAGVSLESLPAEDRQALRSALGARIEGRLILETVLLHAAEEHGIESTTEEVSSRLEKLSVTLPPGETLERTLAKMDRNVDWLHGQMIRAIRIEKLLDRVAEGKDDENEARRAVEDYVAGLVEKAEVVRANPPAALPHEHGAAEESGTAETAWLTDWDEARRRARETGRPILVNFTGSDWCSYCVRLQREVFATPEFSGWAVENVVLLEIDFPRRPLPDAQREHNEALQARFGVRGFPTVLFLDADGDVLGRSGYVVGGPEAWIKNAENAIAHG